MKSNKNPKSRSMNLGRRLHRKNKYSILFIFLGVVLLLGCSYLVLRVVRYEKNSSKIQPLESITLATIQIESSVPGIEIKGSPYCDSTQLHKQTPYTCVLPRGYDETVISAPADIVVKSVSYSFKTWDGCSESNTDKKICRIKVRHNNAKIAKASYEKASSTSATSSSVTESASIGCPAAKKYVMVGPQSFDSAKPAQLVLYNKTHNPFDSTYVQIWSGNTCKEVSLKHELRATAPHNGNIDSWGLTTSPHPKDVHAYIGVIDNGKTQHPEAIIRDDGLLTADEAYLETKFSVGPGIYWRFIAWLDNKTMLIHVGNDPNHWGENANYPDYDSNPDNWFNYNVETDSFTHKLPPQPLYYID